MSNPLGSMSIRLTFAESSRSGGDVLAKTLAVLKPNEKVRKAVERGLGLLNTQAVEERLTGQGPFPVSAHRLGVRSGRLIRAMYASQVVTTADGYSGRVGSSVEYFGVHEFGFSGPVSVRAHTRQAATTAKPGPWRATKGGKLTGKAELQSVRKGNLLLLPSSVRAHTRNVKIAARMPLRTAIDQHAARILSDEIRAVIQAL